MPDLAGPSLRALDLSTLAVTTMAGTRGQWTFSPGAGSQARFNAPGPITFDAVHQAILLYDERENVFLRVR